MYPAITNASSRVMLSGSEESEVGHAVRLVRPDASLPLSMTRQEAFFYGIATRMALGNGLLSGLHRTQMRRRTSISGGKLISLRSPDQNNCFMISATA